MGNQVSRSAPEEGTCGSHRLSTLPAAAKLFPLGGGNPFGMMGERNRRVDASLREKRAGRPQHGDEQLRRVAAPLQRAVPRSSEVGPRLMNDIRQPNLTDLAKKLKEEYQPLNFGPDVKDMAAAAQGLSKLGEQHADLESLLKRHDRPTLFDQAWEGMLGSAARNWALRGRPSCPMPAMKDTTESVRILNQWQAWRGKADIGIAPRTDP